MKPAVSWHTTLFAKPINKPMQNKENPLGYAPVVRLIAKFAIPSIISMLVTSAYNITDQIFIGHVVGMYGNAATNVAFPIVTLTLAFAQLVGVGTAANFNICLGAKEEEEAQKYVGTGLTLIPIMGLLIIAIVLLFKTPILMFCGATDNVFPLAHLYLGITVFGIPFSLLFSAGSFLIRADGSPTYSMICTISGAVLNVFLDWLFMSGYNGGFGVRLWQQSSVKFSLRHCALDISSSLKTSKSSGICWA